MSMSSIFSKPVRRGRETSASRERVAAAATPPDPKAPRPFLLDLVDRWGRR